MKASPARPPWSPILHATSGMLYTLDGTGKVNWKEVAYYMLKIGKHSNNDARNAFIYILAGVLSFMLKVTLLDRHYTLRESVSL